MTSLIPTAGARVLVPLDLATQGEGALAHALAIALHTRGRVVPANVHPRGTAADWTAMPRVRDLLVRWGHVHEAEGPEALERLGLTVEPLDLTAASPAEALSSEVARHPVDLAVMHVGARDAVGRWLQASQSLAIARSLPSAVLFLPPMARGLVDVQTGRVALRNVLLPVTSADLANHEVAAAEAFARALGVDRAHGTLLHVGAGDLPNISLSEGWAWDTRREQGRVHTSIVDTADALQVDLIVMVTRGHTSWADMLFGSTTEQVVQRAHCPVLAVPAAG